MDKTKGGRERRKKYYETGRDDGRKRKRNG